LGLVRTTIRAGSQNSEILIDLVGRHLPRDIPHLLADVVVPSTGSEGFELSLRCSPGVSNFAGSTEM
jgi:hypothetical protein